MVVPSRNEPFGIVVLEGWACAKPVMVVGVGVGVAGVVAIAVGGGGVLAAAAAAAAAAAVAAVVGVNQRSPKERRGFRGEEEGSRQR